MGHLIHEARDHVSCRRRRIAGPGTIGPTGTGRQPCRMPADETVRGRAAGTEHGHAAGAGHGGEQGPGLVVALEVLVLGHRVGHDARAGLHRGPAVGPSTTIVRMAMAVSMLPEKSR